MKKIQLFTISTLLCLTVCAQKNTLKQLQKIKGITVTVKQNNDFNEYYIITIEQPVDHFHNTGKVFKQRIYVSINNTLAPTVMETQGYAIQTATNLPFLKEYNSINIEHRYYGNSIPDSMEWEYLTVKQAASDYHYIRELFKNIFTGTWMSMGISKGGQAAIAYKMYFPNDVAATLAYVTPIKNSINDVRLADYLHSIQSTECGAKIYALQKYIFENKATFLTAFNKRVVSDFDNETVFDYMLLEYPFAFFQNCFNCASVPDTISPTEQILDGIIEAVPLRFYSTAFKQRLMPSFYMFYHELGYYEYDLTSVKKWLKNKEYPNNIFAPDNATLNFDTSYLYNINKFITSPEEHKIIFVYGRLDPYTALKANSPHVFIAKNGCHKSRINDLSAAQQKEIFVLLSNWLKCSVGY